MIFPLDFRRDDAPSQPFADSRGDIHAGRVAGVLVLGAVRAGGRSRGQAARHQKRGRVAIGSWRFQNPGTVCASSRRRTLGSERMMVMTIERQSRFGGEAVIYCRRFAASLSTSRS